MIDKIINDMLKTPAEWTKGRFTFKHKPSGLEVWIANDFWFYGIELPTSLKERWSFWNKVKFYFAYRAWLKWRKNKMWEARQEEAKKWQFQNNERFSQ